MARRSTFRLALSAALIATLAACSGGSGSFGSSPFGSLGLSGGGRGAPTATQQAARTRGVENVAVNRYLWAAAIDTLSFLPIESVDPFTGVIVFGYGRPPGSSRAYRGTVYITDPALDARSLNVALQTQSGPVAAETQRVVEDAILARARQLRIADGRI